jgi:hypothetical protein
MTTTQVIIPVDNIVNRFPNKINKIHGLPTFETLRQMKKDLQLNAASVPSALGGGAHGYLGILLSDAAYGAESGNDATTGLPKLFIKPIFPGNQPTIIGTTKEDRDGELRVFNYQTYAWCMYDNMHQALRTILLKAIEDTYLSPLKSQVTGYRNVSVATILTHLFKEYGDIGLNEMHKNDQRFNEAWDGAEPFENIITRIEDCIDYASSASAPYSAIQILSRAKRVVAETRLYHDDIEKWDENLFLAKDWPTFKAYILAAQRKQHKQSATSKQTGYGLAIQKMTDLAEGVAGVANAVSAMDAKTDARITALTAELSLMRKQHSEMMARFNASAVTPIPAAVAAPVAAPVVAPAAAPREPRERYKRIPKDDGSYCHTHGYWVTKSHTSANCKWPKEGHQITATRANPMGGCEHGKPTA